MIYQGPQPTSHPGTPVMLCLLDGMAAMNDDNDARHGAADGRLEDDGLNSLLNIYEIQFIPR